jgi:hypothetical protein
MTMETKYIEKWIDAKGNVHFLDQSGNSYEPISGEVAGMGSFLSNLFAPKEGGTVVGNIIRSAGTLISGGSATVQPHSTVPQQQMPYAPQPVVVAPRNSNNNILMIGAGVAVLAAVVLLVGKKEK